MRLPVEVHDDIRHQLDPIVVQGLTEFASPERVSGILVRS
jgi:hypothetical protein